MTKEELLWISCEQGWDSLVQILFEYGANIREEGELALILSATSENLKIVKFLISNGAHVNAQGDLALILASQKGDVEIVKFLIQKGARAHARNSKALLSPLFCRNTEIINILLSHGASFNDIYHSHCKDLISKELIQQYYDELKTI